MKVAVIYNKTHVEASDVINIFGPQTKERYNPKVVEKVARSLEKSGHNVKVIEGNIHVVDELHNFMPRVIAGERPGIVFNMAYGIQGQSRYTHIPAMLEMLGVPYVGSGPQAHATALDKIMSKIIFHSHHLATPQFWMFNNPEENLSKVIYPVIVKPKMEAVSMGLKVVHNQAELSEAIEYIREKYQQQALVEQFIPGREFAVGLLGNPPDLENLPVVEFDFHGNPDAIQSHEDKQKKPVTKICPADISTDLAHRMQALARGAFQALGISDFARVDLRMDATGNLYILELNSMASLGFTGSYVHAAKVAGYNYQTLVDRMLEVAALRYFGTIFIQSASVDKAVQDETKPLRVRVRTYLRGNSATMLDNLHRMVEINSYVYNTEGVQKLGTLLAKRLGQLGFQREVFPQGEVGDMLYFTNHTAKKNDILLLSHLDTGYSYQDYVPYREERGRIYGSGVADCKGGLAIMLGALSALRYTRRLKKLRCSILLTSDDTLGGTYSQSLIKPIARNANYVVGLRYGDLNGSLVVSCSGNAHYEIELTNIKKANSQTAADVIKTTCQKVITWQKLTDMDKGVFVKPAFLEARTHFGLAPDFAAVSLKTQYVKRAQGEELENQIRRIAKRGVSRSFNVHIKKNISRPPLQPRELTHSFFQHVQQIARRLEVKVRPVHHATSSDVSYVPESIPVLEGLGPMGINRESRNEYILKDSMVDRAAILAMVIRLSCEELAA